MRLILAVFLCLSVASAEAAVVSVRLDAVIGGDDHGETPGVVSGTLGGVYNTVSGVVVMVAGSSSITFPSLSQAGNILFTDVHTDWETGGTGYSAGGYGCVEGTFDSPAGFCGNYFFGSNGVDESSLDYSAIPGTRIVGGDDVAVGPMRQGQLYATSMSSFDGIALIMRSDLWNNLGPGGTSTDGLQLTFSVVPVPAAIWLFGSALGLLGWSRRGSA